MVTVDRPGTGLCSYESPSTGTLRTSFRYEDSIDRFNRIVGLREICTLLQPGHNYFKDKKGFIISYRGYKHPEQEKMLLYPVISGPQNEKLNRGNPLRRHQLARGHTARRVRMIMDLIESYHLADFNIAFMTLTMPKQISLWLSCEKNGNDMAWRMFKKMWAWYDANLGSGLAASVNLHTWKTENPIEPHYHFHCLIPNYRAIDSGITDDDNEKTYQLIMQEWHKQRGGKIVPVSENTMELVKQAWWSILDKFAKRHNIPWERMKCKELGAKKINMHYAYTGVENEIGKAKLIHWFNYQGRYPLEDYAKYSNENMDCDNPPEFTEKYDNRARSFGWWKYMKTMIPIKDREKEKINPVTGKTMEQWGTWTIYELLNQGPLGFLDVVRGIPVFHRLNGMEINYLISAQKYRHPVIERAMLYEYQAEYENERGQYD